MRFQMSAVAVLATLTLVLAACARPESRPADSATGAISSASDETAAGTRRRAIDLTGDGVPESLVVTAAGDRSDSLQVRLEIRSKDGERRYADSWSSRAYFSYDADFASVPDSARERRVREQLDRLLSDSAFTAAGRGTRSDSAQRRGEMRDAIRFDLAERRWRIEHGVPRGVELPIAGHEALNEYARRIPADSVERLVDELWGMPTFRYFAGGEVTYIVAWSDRLGRFVRIFACC